jgi:hypothetical protein
MADLDQPHNTSRPGPAKFDVFQFGEDTAKYLLKPDVQFERPWIAVPGGDAFIFPAGVEGFEYNGTAEIALHKYLGDDEIDVSMTHRDEPHFTINGQFPGKTSVNNMLACKAVIAANTPERGKILHLPFILPRIQYVVIQDYNFSHSEDDRTETIAYRIQFLKIGVGKRISPGEPDPPSPNPDTQPVKDPKGKDQKQFVVKQGFQTLRKIAKKVYNNPDKWLVLFNKNHKRLEKIGINKHVAPNNMLPIGFIIYYSK